MIKAMASPSMSGNYAVMDVGVNLSDSSIKMAGYWRSPMNNEEGKLYLTITKQNGADDIISKKFTVSKLIGQNISIDGKTAEVELSFERFFSNKVLNNLKFSIIAHRAGGRNSDNIPFAENSIELVKRASEMGASGVEIDIKLTKDNIPVVYHDDDINIRLTQKGPVVGNIEDFNSSPCMWLSSSTKGLLPLNGLVGSKYSYKEANDSFVEINKIFTAAVQSHLLAAI